MAYTLGVANPLFTTQNSGNAAKQEQKKTHKRCNFTYEEDNYLRYLVSKFGENNWGVVSSFMPNRNVRQCRERWFKYLSPTVKNNEWTEAEDMLLVQKRKELGPKWKEISQFFDGRTDINIKSRYNVLKRKVMRRESLLKSGFFKQPLQDMNKANIFQVEETNSFLDNKDDPMQEMWDPFANSIDWFDPISLEL